MPTPNADDPLRTTDHAPTLEPAVCAETLTKDAPETEDATPSSIGQVSVTLQPREGVETQHRSSTVSTEPPPPSIPGYEIESVLGRGGMGVVYKARHLALKRTVALKMILAGGHAGPRELARFRIEAEAVARLQHPSIVQIHEIGEAGGHPYCALEFVEGGNLAGRIDGKPMPVLEAARLAEALARAMQLAHSRNVVHRDLKPANVLVAADGTPKITDFGLARQTDRDSGETQAGAVMGTPSYMAPEQAEGHAHEAGPAADVYALGAILYDCLAGRPPFKGKTIVETLDQVRTQEPVPPSRWQPSVPLDLDTICLKCLQKEPEKRYASAAELADDLVRYQNGEPILARPVGRVERTVKWVRRNPVAAALLLVTVLGVAGIVWKYTEAEKQKEIAEGKEQEARQKSDKAQKAQDYLESIFNKGGNVTVRELLAEAEKDISVKFATQPELRQDMVEVIGRVKRNIGRRTPQAMFLEVRGTVQLRSATGESKAAEPQALVNLDDRLTLSPDAQVQLVFLSDMHKERLKPGREATIDWIGCEPADAVLERDNSIVMTFVRLPKATFYMGGGIDPKTKELRRGLNKRIRQDFEIAVHDVTQGQWEAIMGKQGSFYAREGPYRESVLDISDEELKLFPVAGVSWDDAQEFIKKLNEKERGHGYLYRLPTEAEWEYACRAGATSEEDCSYNFYLDRPTNDLTSDKANIDGNYPYGNAPKGKNLGRPTRVGAYSPNKLGLCDMHGNVMQWCADLFTPKGPTRVTRGGSFTANVMSSRGTTFRAADRHGWSPSSRLAYQGFRLVRVPATEAGIPTSPDAPATMEIDLALVSFWNAFVDGQSVTGPVVHLNLAGPGLAEAKGIRIVVKTAKDDAGKPLRRYAGFPEFRPGVEAGNDDDGKFRPLRNPFGEEPGASRLAKEAEQTLSYYLPPTVKSIKTLAGNIELLMPTKDPASIVTASFANDAGKPLTSEVLRAAGVEVTLFKPTGNNFLYYQIKDPKHHVGAVEFFDAGGKQLKSNGFSWNSFTQTRGASFDAKVAAGTVARIYLITEKSLVSVPFDYKDIPARVISSQ